MYKIGFICDESYVDKVSFLKFLKKIKDTYYNTVSFYHNGIETICNNEVKKFSLLNNIKFGEYNPAYTGYKMYSVMSLDYFEGKKYHASQILHRYDLMLKNIDYLFIFIDKNKKLNTFEYNYIFKKIRNKLLFKNTYIIK